MSVTLTNPTRRNLPFTLLVNADYQDIFVVQDIPQKSLKAKTQQSFDIIFRPKFDSTVQTTCILETELGSSSMVITGTGIVPRIEIQGLELDFGIVGVGQPEFREFKVTNPTAAEWRVRFVCQNQNFYIFPREISLEPGQDFSVTAEFHPSRSSVVEKGAVEMIMLGQSRDKPLDDMHYSQLGEIMLVKTIVFEGKGGIFGMVADGKSMKADVNIDSEEEYDDFDSDTRPVIHGKNFDLKDSMTISKLKSGSDSSELPTTPTNSRPEARRERRRKQPSDIEVDADYDKAGFRSPFSPASRGTPDSEGVRKSRLSHVDTPDAKSTDNPFDLRFKANLDTANSEADISKGSLSSKESAPEQSYDESKKDNTRKSQGLNHLQDQGASTRPAQENQKDDSPEVEARKRHRTPRKTPKKFEATVREPLMVFLPKLNVTSTVKKTFPLENSGDIPLVLSVMNYSGELLGSAAHVSKGGFFAATISPSILDIPAKSTTIVTVSVDGLGIGEDVFDFLISTTRHIVPIAFSVCINCNVVDALGDNLKVFVRADTSFESMLNFKDNEASLYGCDDQLWKLVLPIVRISAVLPSKELMIVNPVQVILF